MTSTDWTSVTVDEQISRANSSGRTPVVFVHGLWLLRSSWNRWAEVFDRAGYTAVAPAWPDDPEPVGEAFVQALRVGWLTFGARAADS